MEFIGYGSGQEDAPAPEYSAGHGQMSECVQAMAQQIYEELEMLVNRYGTTSAQTITPIIVNVLEQLNEEIILRRKIQTDLELARADREQLLNHYERERELRRKAEERHFNYEDEHDIDKSVLRSQLENLEGKMRYLDSRAENYDHISQKAVESENLFRNKFADLSKKHEDFLQKYYGVIEENRLLKKLSNHSLVENHSARQLQISKLLSSMEIYNISLPASTMLIEQVDDDETRDKLEHSEKKKVYSDIGDPPLDFSSELPQEVKDLVCNASILPEDDHKNGKLNQEFSQFDNIDESNSANLQTFNQISLLKQEYANLLKTKNALNIVKDDLLNELDQVTAKYTKLKAELKNTKDKEKNQPDNQESPKGSTEQDSCYEVVDGEHDDPTEKKRRFTRVEMARVLMERNQYKERLMELQEAVRWTEMLRASKYEEINQHKVHEHIPRKPSAVQGLFSRLFGTTTTASQPSTQTAETAPGQDSKISPSNSTELYQLTKVANFVQEKESYQMSGWMLPFLAEENPALNVGDVPVPIHCAPVQDKDSANAKIWCGSLIKANGHDALLVSSAARSKSTRIVVMNAHNPQSMLASFTLNDIVVLSQLYVHGSSQSRNNADGRPHPEGTTCEEHEGVSTEIDTIWFGSQHGIIFVYNVPNKNEIYRKPIGQVHLADSVVSLLNNKTKCIIACLANGTIALISSRQFVWDFTSIKVIDFGAPHHAIGCSLLIDKNQKVWCGYRNEIKIVDVDNGMKIVQTVVAHPRRESRIRIMTQHGIGVWVSIRLDSTLRLFHALSGEHLQDIDVEPFVSKMFGNSLYEKPSFSFVRITSLTATKTRLWIGTGHGIVISIPYKDQNILLNEKIGDMQITTDELIPYCSIGDSQLSLHGFRESVKFFIEFDREGETKIAAGGVGYIDFRTANANSLANKSSISSKSHLIIWQH